MICETVNPDDATAVKHCSRCGEYKLLTAFHKKNSNKRYGRQSWCKQCTVSGNADWYQENKEPRKKTIDAWREGNKERRNKTDKEYRERNKERERLRIKRWRVENAEHVALTNKAWIQANPEKCRAYTSFHRSLKLKATPPWLTEDQKDQINEIYFECFRVTQITGIQHEVDHVHPLKGKNFRGLHVPWNLRIVPKLENRSKGNRPPSEEIDFFWTI